MKELKNKYWPKESLNEYENSDEEEGEIIYRFCHIMNVSKFISRQVNKHHFKKCICNSFVVNNIDRFDTSNYPKDNCWNIPLVNKRVPGVMKPQKIGLI